MIIAKAIVTVLAYLFAGSVLHRALAVRLLRFDRVEIAADRGISERDILFLGLLPALALVGAIGTYLALFHLLRPDVTVAVLAASILWRRHDAVATLGALGSLFADGGRATRQIDLVTMTAIAGFAAMAICSIVLAQLPSGIADVWVFQLPLARSMVEHSGFVYPQIDHAFYGSNPAFFNLLFAQALLFVDSFIAANMVNIAIFLGFLLALLTYAPGARGFAFLLIFYFFAASPFFSPAMPFSEAAPAPMTDLSRSCYSVLALLFVDRYLRSGRAYDLVTAGLVVGAAVAGKYTELVTVVLIGLCLLPRLARLERPAWLHALGFSIALVAVAGFWYVKNWLLLGNPIYPFVFGHPGLSDEWMADYMQEMTQAYDPANRGYVTNLLTLQGWHDFIFILYHWFLAGRFEAHLAVAFLIAALLLRPRRLAMLVFCTAALFVIWYTIMFNHIRWATPAFLLFYSSAFVGATVLAEVAWGTWRRRWPNSAVMAPTALTGSGEAPFWARLRSPRSVANLALIAIALVVGARAAVMTSRSGVDDLPFAAAAWKSRDFYNLLAGRIGVDDYLSTRRQGYAIYRYIDEHNLGMVFQPFDEASTENSIAYNGGRDGHLILPYLAMPADLAHADEFLMRQNVRYLVYRPSLSAVEIEKLGAGHVELAYEIFRRLLPRSQLLVADPFGWELYQIMRVPNERP